MTREQLAADELLSCTDAALLEARLRPLLEGFVTDALRRATSDLLAADFDPDALDSAIAALRVQADARVDQAVTLAELLVSRQALLADRDRLVQQLDQMRQVVDAMQASLMDLRRRIGIEHP